MASQKSSPASKPVNAPGNKPANKPTTKMTSDEFAAKMTKLQPQMVRAAKGVLKEAGVPGAKLHSAQFFLSHANLDDPPCADCQDDEVCVFDPLSGTYVCRPR